MRCQGFTEPVVADFSAVREELMIAITEKKNRMAMAETFDNLKDTAQVDNFFEVAKKSPKVASAVKPASAVAPVNPKR
jgi:type I site-specific restriction endonuclease